MKVGYNESMTALANNIIQFPRRGPDRYTGPQTAEDVIDNMEVVKQLHIQETLETVVPMFFDKLAAAGFLPEDELDFLKDGALIVEATRSFLSKIYNVDHPLQLIAQHLFVEIDDEGNLEVSDKVKLVITPTTPEEKS